MFLAQSSYLVAIATLSVRDVYLIITFGWDLLILAYMIRSDVRNESKGHIRLKASGLCVPAIIIVGNIVVAGMLPFVLQFEPLYLGMNAGHWVWIVGPTLIELVMFFYVCFNYKSHQQDIENQLEISLETPPGKQSK
ncbi:hypothetical protein HDU85_002423 [Gaertneriomyces sp. JEL0708]|nr:hypothetical protein HDU85_002423 [Gaertneriomyces sp. JEL0708]